MKTTLSDRRNFSKTIVMVCLFSVFTFNSSTAPVSAIESKSHVKISKPQVVNPLQGFTSGPKGTVLLNGKTYRGLGLNYLDCFTRTLKNNADTSYEAGFKVLVGYSIPFVRCAFSSISSTIDFSLYQSDREAYFRLMDGVIKCAEKNGIGLIPSLFWGSYVIPNLVGEHGDQWGNKKSKTMQFMRQYTHEVVSRYLNSPAIYAWEFCNEFNSYADWPENRKAGLPKRVFPDPRDYPTHDNMIVAFREFAKAVRHDDQYRIIESGADFPKPAAWHYWKEHNTTLDTSAQFEIMLGLNAANQMNLISVHCYQDYSADNFKRLDDAAVAARNIGKPLFVGEFQYPKKYSPDSPEARRSVLDFLDKLDHLKVPLSALWVFDFHNQEADRNITTTNKRSWELTLVREHNIKVALP